jgi:hypothetical protein
MRELGMGAAVLWQVGKAAAEVTDARLTEMQGGPRRKF